MAKRKIFSCSTCEHGGCCEHYCGGAYWTPATYGEDDDLENRPEEPDPYEDGPDPYDKWEHDSEVWQEMADRKW